MTRRPVLALACVLLTTTLLVAVTLLWTHEHSMAAQKSRLKARLTEGAAAARSLLPTFADISSPDPAVNTGRAKSVATPGLAKAYDSEYGPDLRAALAQQETVRNTVTTAEPIRESADGKQVQVLAFVVQHATVAGKQAPDQTLQYTLTLDDSTGRWLIAGADAVS